MADTEPLPLRNNAVRYSPHRRRQLIQKATSFVERDLRHVFSNSPFLCSRRDSTSAALVHRSEVLTGSLLGKGGFSEVHEIIGLALNPNISRQLSLEEQSKREQLKRSCIDPTTGRCRYALKHLKAQLLEEQTPDEFYYAASDLAVEAHYMSAFDHPNILSLRALPLNGTKSFSESDGDHDSFFIICDKLEGTLDSKIEEWAQSDMGVLEKSRLALQLADALSYLHTRRIVFRDLKPQNIGFTSNGSLQLFDFGLCRELPYDGSNSMNTTYDMSGVGTRRYMAPEVVRDGRYNCKADVYGWSMVVWEMLTGQKPFPTYSMEEHRQNVCLQHERPYLSRSIPYAISNLLKKAWTPMVRQRLSAYEVANALREMIEATHVVRRPQQMPVSPPRSPTTVVLAYRPQESGKPRAFQAPPTSYLPEPSVIVVEDDDMDVTFTVHEEELELATPEILVRQYYDLQQPIL